MSIRVHCQTAARIREHFPTRPATRGRSAGGRGGVWRAGLWLAVAHAGALQAASVAPFEGHGDIGAVNRPGGVVQDARRGTFLVSGGGDNMWFGQDAFHFVWRRFDGDFTFTAHIRWPEAGGNPHRKAALLVRQSLAPDAPYVDAVLHGDGLTSLQYREAAGGPTREIQSAVVAPQTLRLERAGGFFALHVARAGEPLRPAGGAVGLALTDPVYVGLGVCAHDSNRVERAEFARVELERMPPPATTNLTVESTLEVVSIASRDRRVIYHTTDHIEAPNWSPDGAFLLFNSRGRIHRFALPAGPAEEVDTGFARRCNNDHGLSPDGRILAISDQTETGDSLIYLLPAAGGTPRRVTPRGPSYWHGWSPDGRTLVYCAERSGAYDIYAIPAEGGEERRLTTATGLDDGPDYTPDGQYIYFNSERTGTMKIWRMRPDGAHQEQVTFDDANDWFPHPSPDGRWIVFLSYAPGIKGHPPNQDVRLRLMPVGGGEIQILARLFGGQGTINVPSWSPDSRQIAFVSYRPVRR